jgi:putative ABC transport system permease protein
MRWPRWFRRNRLDRDLARELDTHLDLHVHHLMAGGVSRAEARRRARLELGGVDQVTEQVRDVRAGAWLDSAMHDARDAFRGLKRTPGVTLTAIALIALVIGGNTTIYSMVHAVLTKPAPGVRGNGLVSLELRIDGRPAGPEHSYPDYLEYAAQTTTLVPLLAMQFQRFVVGIDEGTYGFSGGLVSSNYFDTLGVRLARGRTFTSADELSSGLVAVISDDIWRTQFGGDEHVVGRTLVLNGHAATIVGVAPPRFHGATVGEMGEVWVPLIAFHRLRGTSGALRDRTVAPTQVIGRLAPGVSLSQARVEFATISSRLQAAYPATNRNRSVGIVPYSMTSGGNSIIATGARRFLAIFSIVTALTLAIVCANVANLMLGRAVLRQRELALRQTLGASRGRILRTLLAESVILAVAAWGAACIFALAVSKGVIHLFPQSAQGSRLVLDLAPDWQVVAYAFGLAVAGTVAFTLAPAVRAWKQELLPSLRSGELGVVAGRSKLSSVLVVLQLGFAVLLLTSAGLAYRSVSMLGSMDAGFNKENLVLVNVETSDAEATAGAHLALLDNIRERLRSVPGVRSVAYVGPNWRQEPVRVETSQLPVIVTTMTVGSEYFSTLGMVPVAGQEFANREGHRSPPPVLVTQHLAQSLWPRQAPIGRMLALGQQRERVEVVGVVPDGVFSRFQRETPASYVFRSLAQQPLSRNAQSFTFYIRHAGTLDTVAPAINRAVREVDRRVPVSSLRTMETELDGFASGVRIVTIWITLFALGSLMIAAIGQYAVIAFDMRRRTRDFGVRIALGASSRQIVGAVIAEGLRWTAAGLAIGFTLSIAAGRAGRSLLVGITPTDAPTYLGVFTLLAAASMLACYLPARRAARIDPIQALRHE